MEPNLHRRESGVIQLRTLGAAIPPLVPQFNPATPPVHPRKEAASKFMLVNKSLILLYAYFLGPLVALRLLIDSFFFPHHEFVFAALPASAPSFGP